MYNAIQQTQLEQQQQARQLHDAHMAAVETYNQFVQKEFAEPDFKEIQNFARNEFFEQLSPNEKQILANSYLHVERQIAYEPAKEAYRTRSAKKSAPKQPPPKFPRTDQLKGSSGTGDGQFSARDVEKMRTDMRKVLSAWLARYFDLSIFAVLTGTQPPFETRPGQTLELPYTILYAGSATSENSITASDVFAATRSGLRLKNTQTIYEGVVIHECLRVGRTQTGSGTNQLTVAVQIRRHEPDGLWRHQRFDFFGGRK